MCAITIQKLAYDMREELKFLLWISRKQYIDEMLNSRMRGGLIMR